MKLRLPQLLALSLTALTMGTAHAQALDPTFQAATLYQPAATSAAVAQPDGKRIVVGSSIRSGATTTPLVRYNADNTVDEAFATNIATLRGSISNVRVLASGKLLLVGDGPMAISGLTRQDLLLLNADGTADASFDAGTASGTGVARVSAVQADGRVLLGGSFTTYNGVSARYIVRLLPTGTIDPSFSAGNQFNSIVQEITLQADGKILVGGSFDSPAAVARLLPSGALDATFTSPLATTARVSVIGVQADGNILLGSDDFTLSFANGIETVLARLLPNGTPDPAFLVNTNSSTGLITNTSDANEFVLQPDGRCIVPLRYTYNGIPTNSLIRLNTNGTLDGTFVAPFASTGYSAVINSVQRLASGQLLVAGSGFRLAGRRNNVVQLSTTGTVDATFNPTLLTFGSVLSVAQQADGKVLAGGRFDEVNGVRAAGLARFNADGTVDAAFTGQSANNFLVTKVAVQADGNVLLAGAEPRVGGNVGTSMLRLLPSGAPDNTFQLAANTTVTTFAQQPDGRIVTTNDAGVKRLLANGQLDNSFTIGEQDGLVYTLAVQADGKILVGGYWENYNNTAVRNLVRLLPSGALDPAFASPIQTVVDAEVDELLIQPDGKIVAGGYSDSRLPSTVPYGLFRLLPSGATDNTFSATLPTFNNFGFVRSLALQPNGRILVAAYGNGLLRVLPNGQPDASFGALSFGNDAEDLLIQPDGKIVAGGYFTSVGGQPIMGLTRLTAPNVLHVANAQLEARTQAWPVPAHEALNLAFDAAAQPQSVQLLDNLGRTVLSQPVMQPTLTLPVEQLRAGVYLLRVNYAEGPVTRRVVVE